MANASINGHQNTKIGNFTLIANFEESVSGFGNANVSISVAGISASGNGITGVTYNVMGVGKGYNIIFVLPVGVVGQFRVELTGSVTPEGSSQAEPIVASHVVIEYDTVAEISATVGDIVYHPDGEIEIPISFSSLVIHFSKTDCELESLPKGDDIFDFDYYLTGSGRQYQLRVLPDEGKIGAFLLTIPGEVYKVGTSVSKPVMITPKLVPFNSKIPQIIDYESLSELRAGTWDVRMELDIPDEGLDTDNLFYEGEINGVDLDTDPPTLYRAMSLDVKPDTPPAPADPSNPPDCVGDWVRQRPGVNRTPARYILIRFNVPSGADGQLTVVPKPNAFRATTPQLKL